jgi:hypothetical protein
MRLKIRHICHEGVKHSLHFSQSGFRVQNGNASIEFNRASDVYTALVITSIFFFQSKYFLKMRQHNGVMLLVDRNRRIY